MKARLSKAYTDQEKERIRLVMEADRVKAQEKIDLIKQ
jgi:hypothetical protein